MIDEQKYEMKAVPDGRRALGRGIPSIHLIHRTLWLEKPTGRRQFPPVENLCWVWWRRMELDQTREETKTRRLETKVKKTEEEMLKRKNININFLKKYYPNLSTKPGGSIRLTSHM